ncbi:MAG: ABC-F family ATP-binding cassette domain-containing protein [Alphaproteobacteria bacterium]|uniref:ABC-F family ATP-binding cassette domain-containing protein n=1 Tax=Candidatus Nitrobium versatile TaxID=2884831 RepID=A0A953M372_9BACT|nr:ABC-F family ATP-binding cassette domain-containing protein [Candidatus Nitrobium versatile]
MIQVSSVDKAYGKQVIFDSISFTINAGERVGLVGRNGHGKTTLFRMIIGDEKPDGGVISIPNDYSLGHLSQHINFSVDTVLREACLSLPSNDEGSDETYKVKSILMGLGFTGDDFSRPPSSLSGGYQIRLNLAKVLVREPNLLLLDEPTNYLDILSVRWLTQFLRAWKNEMIIITHDRDFMDSVTTHTMGIHRCKVRKIAGPTLKLYDQILAEEEVYERTRSNDEKKRREIEQFIERFRAKATKARAVQSKVKALQKRERMEKLSVIKDLDFTFNDAPFLGKWLLEGDRISFSYGTESRPLINNFSIAVGKGDRIAIIGKNGKGKTTLLNLLAGELHPLQGTVTPHTKAQLAYFGQTNIDRLNPQKTVEEEILDALPEFNRKAARNICGIMMFEGDAALKKVSVLSGGERSRVLLGKLLVSPANLLLLDEPTNHLDMESIDSLLGALSVFEGAVMIITHSEMILHALATRLIVFDDNEVTVFEGTYQDFLDRVGWKSEEPESPAAGQNGNGPQGRNSGNRKDVRRIRAGIITSRSRIVGALQGKIAEIENAIMRLEEEVEKSNQALLDASMKGDGEAIRTLSKSLRDAKERIDSLFDELAVLTEELEARSLEFDEKLNTL